MQRVKLTQAHGRHFRAGEVLELDDASAKSLIDRGMAQPHDGGREPREPRPGATNVAVVGEPHTP